MPLHIWFRQQRELDHPVSGVLLQEKARVLFEQLYSESTAGTCSKEESFFQTTDACFIINNT